MIKLLTYKEGENEEGSPFFKLTDAWDNDYLIEQREFYNLIDEGKFQGNYTRMYFNLEFKLVNNLIKVIRNVSTPN